MNGHTEGHYVALHGAFTNAGDHLIKDRAVALLRDLRPDRDIILRDRREALDPHDPIVSHARAILLLGGPAWQRASYPGIYRLVAPLSELVPPVIPIGLGWRGTLATSASFEFDEQTVQLIKRIEADGHWGTCRDTTTLAVLESAGLSRQLMAGCPSWYDLEKLRSPPRVTDEVRTVAFSVGALSSGSPAFAEFEATIVGTLVARYPGARVIGVFHHPTTPTPGYPRTRSHSHAVLATRLEELGAEIRVVSGGSRSLIDTYHTADLHVGFRVHAHLARCSARSPSLLLAEDARAHAMCRSLGHSAIEAVLQDGVDAIPREEAIHQMTVALDASESAGWPWLSSVAGMIDGTYDVMRWVLERLP